MKRVSSPWLAAAVALGLAACSSEQPDTTETDALDTSGDVIVTDERVAPVAPSATAAPMTGAATSMPGETPTPESTMTGSAPTATP